MRSNRIHGLIREAFPYVQSFPRYMFFISVILSIFTKYLNAKYDFKLVWNHRKIFIVPKLRWDMAIVQTRCWVQKPVDGYFKDCFTIFGIGVQTWMYLMIVSLIVGFSGYYIYSLIRKTTFEIKNFLIKSLLISIVVLVVLLLLRMWWKSQIIYWTRINLHF